MEVLYNQYDVSILFYENLYVSNELLSIAAKNRKYCLISDKIFSEFVNQYELGSKASPEEINGIYGAIKEIINLNSLPTIIGEIFYKNHTPGFFHQDFIKHLINFNKF